MQTIIDSNSHQSTIPNVLVKYLDTLNSKNMEPLKFFFGEKHSSSELSHFNLRPNSSYNNGGICPFI